MREILFRGKREDGGEWIYGSLIEYPHIDNGKLLGYDYGICPKITQEIWGNVKDETELLEEIVITETVGQFVGKTGKHGKQIFEGDIVEFYTNLNIYGGEYDAIAKPEEKIKPFWKGVERRENLMGGYRYVRKDQAIVQWNGSNGMWDLKVYNNGRYKRKSKLFTYRSEGDYEVIGNIHDNPELLEGGG